MGQWVGSIAFPGNSYPALGFTPLAGGFLYPVAMVFDPSGDQLDTLGPMGENPWLAVQSIHLPGLANPFRESVKPLIPNPKSNLVNLIHRAIG